MKRARRRRGRKDALGLILGAAILALLGAGMAMAVMLQPPALDPNTLCRLGGPPAGHTLILVDASDALEPRHRRRLKAVALEEAGRLKPGDRLTLLALRADAPREPRALFSLCHPGDGARANPLLANPARIQARFEETFLAPLDKAASRAAAGRRRATQSPLIEAVGAAVREPAFSAEAPGRRFVLVSDLLEHDPAGFSAYTDGADYARYRAAHGGYRPPPLDGATVRLVALDRPEFAARQAAALAALWEPLFAEAGAADVQVEGL